MEGGYFYCDNSTLNRIPLCDTFPCPECDTVVDSLQRLLEHLYDYRSWGDKRKGKTAFNIPEHEKMLQEFLEELSRGDGTNSEAQPSNSMVEPLKERFGIDLNVELDAKLPPVAKVQRFDIDLNVFDLVDLNEEAEVDRFDIDLNLDLNVSF